VVLVFTIFIKVLVEYVATGYTALKDVNAEIFDSRGFIFYTFLQIKKFVTWMF